MARLWLIVLNVIVPSYRTAFAKFAVPMLAEKLLLLKAQNQRKRVKFQEFICLLTVEFAGLYKDFIQCNIGKYRSLKRWFNFKENELTGVVV